MHHRRLRRCIAALALLTSALASAPVAASAATPYESRPGACTGSEGVTVVVDFGPTAGATNAHPVKSRCVFGTPADGIDALDRGGFVVGTADFGWGPFVEQIDDVPNPPNSNGYWSYWHEDDGAWEAYMVGAGDSTPGPGDVEGWRWVASWETDPASPPRVAPRALSVTSTPPTSVVMGADVTIGFAVPDAPATTVACRVDDAAWTPCTTASSHVFSGLAAGTHALQVRAADAWGNETAVRRTVTVTPTPARVDGVALSSVTADAALVTATVHAGGAARLAHAELAVGTDTAAAIRTSATSVAAGTSRALTFPLRMLPEATTFSYRVVTTGDAGSVSTPWTTFETPRSSADVDVDVASTWLRRGTNVRVELARLAPDERFVVALGTRRLHHGRADARGEARVRLRVPAGTPVGSTAIRVEGSQADRRGSAAVTVVTPAHLRVSAPRVVRPGGSPRIEVTGLLPDEPVLVRVAGRVTPVRGTADADGTFVARIPVGLRRGVRVITVRGGHGTRAGRTVLRVVATPVTRARTRR